MSLRNSSVCAQSPVSAGAPGGQRTTSGGNTCADTPNLSFYGHIGGLGCSARKKSKIFGTFCTKNIQTQHSTAQYIQSELKGLIALSLSFATRVPLDSRHTMSFGAFKLQLCNHISPEAEREHITRGSRQQLQRQTNTRVKIVRQSGRTFQSKAESQ